MHKFLWLIANLLTGISIQAADEILASSPFLNLTLDFSKFKSTIESLLLNTSLSEKNCLIPSDAIMFSYTNQYTFPFISLQHNAMDVGGIRACLEQRFVNVCLDYGCTKLCKQEGIPNCIELKLPHVPYGEHQSKRKTL